MLFCTRGDSNRCVYKLLFGGGLPVGAEEFFGAAGQEGLEVFLEDGELDFTVRAGDELAFLVFKYQAAFDRAEGALREMDFAVIGEGVFAEDFRVVLVEGFGEALPEEGLELFEAVGLEELVECPASGFVDHDGACAVFHVIDGVGVGFAEEGFCGGTGLAVVVAPCQAQQSH